jgi:mediator of RNA polymerase II transcription subunit 17, fungi type
MDTDKEKENSMPLALQPWPKQSDDLNSLKAITGRIHAKYGGFRHITEDELRKQIEDEGEDATGKPAVVSAKDESVEAESEKGSTQYITANRLKMMQYLNTALNETLILLDFTSLLESTYQKRQAETTMSQLLKQKAPAGSLALDEWESIPPPSDEKLRDNEMVARGARMEGMTAAVDALLNAATRLETDVKNETRYWNHLLNVHRKGWTVFRNPLDRRHLGVQVASIEAGPFFRGQGLVTFEPDNIGDITLKHSAASEPKMLRVQLEESGKIVGSSRVNLLPSHNAIDDPLEDQVLRARDSLFEEELFHEMIIETRSLLSIGVQVRGDTVRIPITNTLGGELSPALIVVDLINLEDAQNSMESDLPGNQFAQSIALSLRILLSNLHRQRLHRRTSRPPPLSDQHQPTPPSGIIRPLMRFLQHQSALTTIQSFANSLCTVLKKAGLATGYELSTTPTTSSNTSQISPFDPKSFTNNHENSPSLSTITISLPTLRDVASNESLITVNVYTNLSQAPFGTNYSLILPPQILQLLYSGASPPSRRFEVSDLQMLYSMLNEVFALHISHIILCGEALQSKTGSLEWSAAEREAVVVGTVKSGAEDKNGWHSIEVSLNQDGASITLALRCISNNFKDAKEQKFQWRASEDMDTKTIVERVEEFAAKV